MHGTVALVLRYGTVRNKLKLCGWLRAVRTKSFLTHFNFVLILLRGRIPFVSLSSHRLNAPYKLEKKAPRRIKLNIFAAIIDQLNSV